MSRKGFTFSIDAMLGVMVLIIFLVAFSYLSAQVKGYGYSFLVLEKRGNDALIVLDKTGILQTRNQTLITDKLNSMLGNSTGWHLEMDLYNYSNGFNLVENLSFGNTYPSNVKIASVYRETVFFGNESFGNNIVKYYVITRLDIWAE